MQNPVFSIIIPSYNTEWSMLKECIDSVRGQSFDKFECIFIDDCSEDTDSVKKIDDYLKCDDRFIFLQNSKNEGVSFSRNKGIETACGSYILFVDADDRVDESLLLKLYEYIEKNSSDTVFFELSKENNGVFAPVFRDINPIDCKVMSDEMVLRMIYSFDFNSPCNIMYSRRIISENNLRFRTDMKLGEDFLFNVDYLKNMKNGGYIRENLYYYRFSPKSATKLFSFEKMQKTGQGYFARKKLLDDYFGKTADYDKLLIKLNSNYIIEIRRHILGAILIDRKDDEITKCLEFPWVCGVLSGKVSGLFNNILKVVFKRKMLAILRILAKLKKIAGA